MLNPQPKARPVLLDRRDSKAAIAALDRAERKRCRKRSGGRCEVVFDIPLPVDPVLAPLAFRCIHKATENHHLISGLGRRNRGKSIRAEHRLMVCQFCHSEITGHVLRPVDGGTKDDAATVRWERVT